MPIKSRAPGPYLRAGHNFFGNRGPKWPFTINKNSWQYRDLVAFWPITNNGSTQSTEKASAGEDHGFVLADPIHRYSGNLQFKHNSSSDGSTFTAEKNFGMYAMDWVGTSNMARLGSGLNDAIPDGNMTFSAWIELDAVNTLEPVMGLFDASGANSYTILYIQDVSGYQLRAASNNSTGSGFNAAIGPFAPTTGTVYHVCGVWTGSSTSSTGRTAYINGIPGTPSTTAVATSRSVQDRFSIAHLDDTTPGHWFSGRAWWYCVWARAFNDAEVYALWHPRTRWDLCKEMGRKTFKHTAASATWPHNPLGHPLVGALGGPIG